MKRLKAKPYDTAEFLKDDETIRFFLEEAFATGDAVFIAKCLGSVARARSMTKLAEETGMSRTSLYKALSGEVSPELGTILKVTRALGYDIVPRPIAEDAAVDAAA
jgi:probable addiction module antidote protein